MAPKIADCIVITGISLAGQNSKNAGRRVIAYFDVRIIDAIELRGCILVRTANDGVAIAPPRFDNSDPRRAIAIVDSSFQNMICVAAREAYKSLGGVDLPDWAMGTKIPLPACRPADDDRDHGTL
ncbi:MAG: hypothetical protein HYX37_01710 [Rhizobiales bacterium]|nr:hypothetical protein [Hyphomicrobiales bacterium]